jgi:aspartate aminotransferase
MLDDAGVTLHAAAGVFYLLGFSRLRKQFAERGIDDGPTLCTRLLAETCAAILPGASFARSENELTARLAYLDFDSAAALAASENIPVDAKLPADFIEH